jgi:acyl-CoA thioester hydrolase
MKFTTHLRVRHYEMDALGHVNNANYQHYLEQAAVEHSESLGFNLQRYRELGGVFVMRRLEIEYLRPAVAGDTLELTTWLHQMRGPRAIRHYEIRRQGQPELLVTAAAVWVWIDINSMRPKAIPNAIMERFTELQQEQVVT